MSNLYQDAILDAKALRASAIANAKAALEEAFEPKIQEMLRAKLSEEEVSEIAEAEEIEEVKHEEKDIKEEVAVEEATEVAESTEINEQELDEILAQLEELDRVEEAKVEETETISEEKEEMEEAKDAEADHMEEAKKDEEEEGEEEEAEEGEEEAGEEGEAPEAEEEEVVDDETKVIDITLGDLKQVLQSVMGAQADLGMPAEEPTADSEAEAEISLDEILDELEAEGAQDIGHYDAADVQAADLQHAEDFGMQEKKEMEMEAKGVEKELKEAKATIEAMRKDLQEVNLLNAKYLYMNKLFKSKSLTESQKMKVINALDRAASVAEVKNAYETLKESFETKKQTIKESIGFASKPAGVAPKANIVEADQFISRWQKLAGINK